MVCECGPNREPLACGFKRGHDGAHAWATLPTFDNGGDPDEYSPAFQDEYRRLWHEARADLQRLEEALEQIVAHDDAGHLPTPTVGLIARAALAAVRKEPDA